MKEFLSRHNQTYTVRLVDEDGSAYDELIALGHRTVPVTVIGDRVITGFDLPALEDALEAFS